MKKILFLIVFFLISTPVLGKTIDWNTTLNQILENSYDIKLTKTDIDISKVKIKEAQSEYFPKLGIYAYGEFNKDLAPENFKQTMYIGNEVIYGSDIYQNAISAGLTYNLWDFGIRGDNLKIAKKDVISKKANYLKTMRDIELNSVELYAKALSEYKEILIKTEILVIEKELLSIKSRLNQAGQVDKPSVIAENIKLKELENDINKISNEYEKTLKDLSFYSKQDYLKDDVLSDFEISNEILSVNIQYDNPPEIQIYNAEIEKKQKELLIAKKKNLPQFTFSANYYLYGASPNDLSSAFDNFGQKGLKFRITGYLPVFDGFKNKSERDRLNLEILRLEIEKEQKIADFNRNAEKINADSNFSKQLLDNNKTMLELINTNISMLDRLNENLLIDKQTYLNEKIKLLNQKLSVQKSQISEFTTAYKKFVLNKYNDNIGKL